MTARITQGSTKSKNRRLEGEGSTKCPGRPTAEQSLASQTETGDGLVSAGLLLRGSDAVECVVHMRSALALRAAPCRLAMQVGGPQL